MASLYPSIVLNCIRCQASIDPRGERCPNCGEALTPFVRLAMAGPIDGKYEIVSRLGAGGMGEVYKVRHVHLHTIRVIKVMRPGVAGEGTDLHERFAREARLATRISHPYVATLHDFSSLPDGSFYMVWEYIEGVNLADVLSQERVLPPRRVARIAIQALRGIDAIHQAGIVHRDISPDNLILTRDSRGTESVKLIDLGIAKQSEGGSDHTQAGFFVGKWRYCSPEHLGMLPAEGRIDGRADIYSFGIVLYEMLAGVPPFTGNSPGDYYRQHARESPKPLRVINPSVPDAPALEALIFKALEKDRDHRFATAGEFADAIELQLATLPGDVALGGVSDATERTPLAAASAVTHRTPLPQPAPSDATMVVPGLRSGSVNEATVVAAPRSDATVVAAIPQHVAPAVATPPATAPKKRSQAPLVIFALLGVLLFGAVVAVGLLYMLGRDDGAQTSVAAATTTTTVAPVPTATVPTPTAVVEPVLTETEATTDAEDESGTSAGESGTVTAPRVPDTAQQPRQLGRASSAPSDDAETEEPEPVDAVPSAVEPAAKSRGGLLDRLRQRRAGGASRSFVDSAEYATNPGKRFLPSYDSLSKGDEVNWSWKNSGVQLGSHSYKVVRVTSLDPGAPAAAVRRLEQQLQSDINDVTEDASGETLNVAAGVVSASNTGTRAGGMTVEVAIRQGGSVVATARHTVRGRNLEDVAAEISEAVAAFIEEN